MVQHRVRDGPDEGTQRGVPGTAPDDDQLRVRRGAHELGSRRTENRPLDNPHGRVLLSPGQEQVTERPGHLSAHLEGDAGIGDDRVGVGRWQCPGVHGSQGAGT